MSRTFHRPARRPGEILDQFQGGTDPADLREITHDTAAALLHRVHAAADPQTVDRVIGFADENGIAELAELWAGAQPVSLPGTLWRLYRIRTSVASGPKEASHSFSKGLEAGLSAEGAVVGTSNPPGPDEIVPLIDQIMRGAFTGDFAVALDRAAAFSQVMAAGVEDTEARPNGEEPGRQWTTLSTELSAAASQWRAGTLY